jgi:hypothetical protein
MSPHSSRLLAAVVAAILLFSATPASAQSSGCSDVLTELRADLEQLRAGAGANSADVRGRAALLFSTATQEHPACARELQAMAVAAEQGRVEAPGANAKGFLGPIGWMWNTVYYRVYSGNAVMMFTFGWGLFLAPVLLVFCFYAVTRGATGAFRRPTAVPPAALTASD